MSKAIEVDPLHRGRKKLSKRERVADILKEGTMTWEEIREAVNTSDCGLKTIFSNLRLTSRFPFEGEDGKFTLMSGKEFRAKKKAQIEGDLYKSRKYISTRAALSKCLLELAELKRSPSDTDEMFAIKYKRKELLSDLWVLRLEKVIDDHNKKYGTNITYQGGLVR